MYPYVTQTYWNYVKKINGKSRAFRESGTLLVVKKIPIVDFSRVPKKQAGSQKNSTYLSVCYLNLLESFKTKWNV